MGGELAPATTLTVDYPTLPIDGAPQGQKTPSFPIYPGISTPGYPSTENINNRPKWVVSGPDVLIGGGYADNIIVDTASWGNAWSWWSPVKANPFISGYGLHTAFAPLPEGMRSGWYEFRLTTRQDLPFTDAVMPIKFTYAQNFSELRTADGKVYKAGDKTLPATGAFKKGAYVLVDEEGGPAALYSLDDELVYRIAGDSINFGKCPAEKTLAIDSPITGKIGYLGAPAAPTWSNCAITSR